MFPAPTPPWRVGQTTKGCCNCPQNTSAMRPAEWPRPPLNYTPIIISSVNKVLSLKKVFSKLSPTKQQKTAHRHLRTNTFNALCRMLIKVKAYYQKIKFAIIWHQIVLKYFLNESYGQFSLNLVIICRKIINFYFNLSKCMVL